MVYLVRQVFRKVRTTWIQDHPKRHYNNSDEQFRSEDSRRQYTKVT